MERKINDIFNFSGWYLSEKKFAESVKKAQSRPYLLNILSIKIKGVWVNNLVSGNHLLISKQYTIPKYCIFWTQNFHLQIVG